MVEIQLIKVLGFMIGLGVSLLKALDPISTMDPQHAFVIMSFSLVGRN